MAKKAPKKNTNSSAQQPKAKKFTATALVAPTNNLAQPANVDFVFKSGIGQATASQFRHGLLINMQSISSTGTINFSAVQAGDAISITGVCTGTCDITINRNTNPATPEHFTAGVILTGYLIN